MIYVPGLGPSNAKLVVCGEAPGGEEEKQGKPFVGPTGHIVRTTLEEAGINPEEVYYTNVVKVRPPGNNIKFLHQIGKSIEDFLPQLDEELEAINPNCILAFGNTALTALTGEKGIEKFRGSLLQTHRGKMKLVSTIHPASLMHAEADGSKMSGWKDMTFIRWDVERAVRQSSFRDFIVPRRNLLVCKSSLDCYRFFERNKGKQFASVDIETFRTFPICISFAFSKDEAMSFPLFNILRYQNEEGISRVELAHIWKAIAEILADNNIFKIGQNFKFDEGLLSTGALNRTVNFGLKTYGFYHDTMLGFRTLYPELPGKLEFIASVLTEEPYWKDEGKEYNPKKDKLNKLLLYNAKDAAVTFECFEEIEKELRERDLYDFFYERVMPLHPFYSRLEGVGLLRDVTVQKHLDKKYEQMEEDLNIEFRQILDELGLDSIPVPNVMSNGLKGQVAALLYGHLKLPLRKGTDEQTLDALMRNSVKDHRKRRVVELTLKIRKVRKTRGTYVNAGTHPDGRIRSGYRITIETGRSSTSILKPPVTTKKLGTAFQTLTKHGEVGSDLRSMYVVDEGYVFLEPDLSAAEARIVAILARDERLIKIFKYGIDKHRVTAAWIFGCCPPMDEFYREEDDNKCRALAKDINKILKTEIADFQRQMGKVFGHAGNYDMGKRQASAEAECSEWKAGQLLDMFHATNPGIRGTFHKEIVEFLQNNQRELTNPFGRKRQFLNKWGHDLFKEAYAYLPQSTVSDHLKFAAIRIEKRLPRIFRIAQESHDSFLALCPINLVDEAIRIFVEELERPINFSRCSLPRGEVIIPCEVKIGKKNWEEMEVIR